MHSHYHTPLISLILSQDRCLNVLNVQLPYPIYLLQLDPENKDKTLTHIIRQWVKSKDFIQFYNLMRKQESITWDKSKLEDYTKQLKDLWYSKSQSKNKEYFKKIDGFNKTAGANLLEKDSKEELRPKAKIIEKTFDKIKKNERVIRKHP